MVIKKLASAFILVSFIFGTCHGRFLSDAKFMNGEVKRTCFDNGLLLQPGQYSHSLDTFLGILKKIEKHQSDPMTVVRYLLHEYAIEKHQLSSRDPTAEELKELQFRDILLEVLEIDINAESIQIPNLELSPYEECALFSMLSHYSYNETNGNGDNDGSRIRYISSKINQTSSPASVNPSSLKTTRPQPQPISVRPYANPVEPLPKSVNPLAKNPWIPDFNRKHREFGVIKIDEEDVVEAVDLSKVLVGIYVALRGEREISLGDAVRRIAGHGKNVDEAISGIGFDLLGVLTLGEIFTRGIVQKRGEFGISGRWQNQPNSFEYVLDMEPGGATASQLKAAYDGYFIGQHIDSVSNNQYPISKLLRTYYSREGIYQDGAYSVCRRSSQSSDLTNEKLEEFTRNYLHLYQKRVMEVTNRDILQTYLNKYGAIISSALPKFCTVSTLDEERATVSTPNDVIFVIVDPQDSRYDDIIQTVVSVGDGLDLSPEQSTITLQIGSTDPELNPQFFNQTVSASAFMRKPTDVKYEDQDFDPNQFSALRTTLTKFKLPNDTTPLTKGQFVIFFDYSTQEHSDAVFLENLKALKIDFPDTEFKAVGSSLKVLLPYVRKSTDVFEDNDDLGDSLEKNILADVRKNPKEVKYVNCKESYGKRKNGDNFIKDVVEVNSERVYRIQPIYFDTSDKMELKFSLLSGSIQACVSMVQTDPKSGPENCKEISITDKNKYLSFERHNYCKNQKLCEPIMFSVTGLKHDNSECREKECLTAHDSIFALSLNHFECNRALHVIVSPILLILSLLSVKYLL